MDGGVVGRSISIRIYPEQDSLTGAVSVKFEFSAFSFSIQALDRIVQSRLGIDFGIWGQGVIDSLGPTLFFKSLYDQFLVGRWPVELFDQLIAQEKDAFFGIPTGAQFYSPCVKMGVNRNAIDRRQGIFVLRSQPSQFGDPFIRNDKTGPVAQNEFTFGFELAARVGFARLDFSSMFDFSFTGQFAQDVTPLVAEFAYLDRKIPDITTMPFRHLVCGMEATKDFASDLGKPRLDGRNRGRFRDWRDVAPG